MYRYTDFAVSHGLRLLLILLLAILAARLLRSLTRRIVALADEDSGVRLGRIREQHVKTMSGVLYSGGVVVIVLVAVLTALPEFGFNITPIAAAAGLASLSVGFGAQYLVRDFINGFLTFLEDQYAVGDIVRVGDVTGRVERLTLRRTVLRDASGAVVSIPNGEIGKVANLSRDWGQLFLDTVVASDQPLDPAFAALDAVATEFRDDPAWSPVLVDGPRLLGVEAVAPQGITLRMQTRTAPTRQDDVARELRRRIQNALNRQGIRQGGAHQVHFLGGGPSPSSTVPVS